MATPVIWNIPHEWSGPSGNICLKCGVQSITHVGPCPYIRIKIPFIPPTSNHIYITSWAMKRRFLSEEANAFKNQVLSEVVPNYLSQIILIDHSKPLSVLYRFYLEPSDVLTTTYGKKNGAISPYKKMDIENRLKLLSDTLSTALGIDDSQFFTVSAQKLSCKLVDKPQVHIYIHQSDLNEFGFNPTLF